MERSLVFYSDLLGLRVVSDNRMTNPDKVQVREAVGRALGVSNLDVRWVILEMPGGVDRLGAGREIELLQWFNPEPKSLPRKQNVCDEGVFWRAFVVQGMRTWYQNLENRGVEFLGPLAEFEWIGGGRGLCYAKDPDGHIVEFHGSL